MNSDRNESVSTVLVTGGAGFIGCAIAPGLVNAFDRVVAVDNLHPQVHPQQCRPDALPDAVELLVADVTEPTTWDRVLKGLTPRVIVHLAAETGTGQSLSEATRHAHVNVVGTTQLLDALTRHSHRPNKIVLTSSRAIYGEGRWEREDGSRFYPGQRHAAMLGAGQWDFAGSSPLPMLASEVEPRPVSVYGATKLAQEHILSAWASAQGVEASILRLQNVYGRGQSLTNPYTGIVTLFCRLAEEGYSIPLYEDGQVIRDFVHIGDVANAVLRAVELPGFEGALDIGSGSPVTIQGLAEEIAELVGAPTPQITAAFRHGDVRHAWADVTPAKESLQWQPQVSLSEGLSDLIDWIRAQPPQE